MSFLSYDSLVGAVNRLNGAAQVLRIQVIGRSFCGRGLFAFCFGNPSGGALIAAGLRGCEHTAGAALLHWTETVCRCLENKTPLCGVDLSRVLKQNGLTILPCLNPDGAEIHARGAKGAGALRPFVESLLQPDTPWLSNAAGVRLDRQFPVGFEPLREQQAFGNCGKPGADGFFGTAPLSEPETRALAAFCREERFSRALLLEEGAAMLSVFPASETAGTRETVLTTKMLAACAGTPFLLPSGAEQWGTFPAWFAETVHHNAFSLSLDSEGDAFYRRIEEALVLFSVL